VPENRKSKNEIVKELVERYRRLLEENLPEEPGTLEEIECITEEIGKEVKKDLESECAGWHGTGYVGSTVLCSCGELARLKNYYNKHVVTLSSELVIQRAYYYCPACGQGFCPLDQKLELDGLSTSIGVRTKIARLAMWIPFEEVSVELGQLLGVHVSKNTVERVAEAIGQTIKRESRDREEFVLSGYADIPKLGPKRLYIGIDGTGVPMRGGTSREAKTGVVYETKEHDGEIRISRPEYLATLERAEVFGERVYAAAFARGVENAREVIVLGDGASWIWRTFRDHYPKAVQILDFFHASEHLNEVARAWYGEGTDKAMRWVKARETDLLSDRAQTVIRSIRSWRPVEEDAIKIRRTNLAYFTRNKNRMRYATFKARGYHIGSGVVESACKTVVGQRLKQSGMHWSEVGAEAILHLRSLLLSQRTADLRPYARAMA